MSDSALESASLDGQALYAWAGRAVAELAARRAEINALNVFPVPDADTGSNMAHTMEAALAEASKVENKELHAVAQALAAGSVRGARGNSGLVLSQVLRALATAAAHDNALDGAAFTHALEVAVQLVDRAISEPVEGTIITVMRAAATAAGQGSLREVVGRAVEAARIALANTPSQLDVLREAGVVDAGGAGFVVLIESLLAEINGEGRLETALPEVHAKPAELEVTFFFAPVTAVDSLEQALSEMGNSLVIARAGEEGAKVHIHSREPGAVIEKAFATGKVSELRLEVLPEALVESPRRIVIALAPPGSVSELYTQAGASVVHPQADVVAAILQQARTSQAQEIILLPNGLLDRRHLVSTELATHAMEQSCIIVPTRHVVSGIAALSVHDQSAPLAVAAYAMTEAVAAMRTTVIDELDAQEQQESQDLNAAIIAAAQPLLSAEAEQMIIFSTQEVDASALSEALGVEVMAFPAQGLDHLVEIGVE